MAQTMIKTDPFPPLKMSFDDFVEWALKNGISAEWVEGEVEYKHVYTDPLTEEKYRAVPVIHNQIRMFIITMINVFSDFHHAGRVHGSRYLIRLLPEGQGRIPDAIFVAKGNTKARFGNKFMEGPADLLVEVVSEDSAYRDYVTKKGEYARSGIREYWLVDSIKQKAVFYQLGANGKYQNAVLDDKGEFHSIAIPGFWLRPEWFWQWDDFRLLDIMREWELLPGEKEA